MTKSKVFAESLPTSCPPHTAKETALDSVFRLIKNEMPIEQDFDSHQQKGTPRPAAVCSCAWASCSFNTTAEDLVKLKGLIKRLPFVAKLNIPSDMGMHDNGKRHINFWRYSDTNLSDFVESVEQAA